MHQLSNCYIQQYINCHCKKSKQKHPRYKKGVAKYKKGLVEKDVKSNGQPRPPAFDRHKNGHGDLTPKHCYFRWSRSPNNQWIQIFYKDTRPQNIKTKEQCFVT